MKGLLSVQISSIFWALSSLVKGHLQRSTDAVTVRFPLILILPSPAKKQERVYVDVRVGVLLKPDAAFDMQQN